MVKKKKQKFTGDENDIIDNQDQEKFLTFKKIKLSDKQIELFNLIKNNKITLALGPPGTSKSFCACYAALKLYEKGECDKIILTKPTEVIGGSPLGFLKGTLEEKISVYMESFISVFSDILLTQPLNQMLLNKDIEYKPVQYMRGATFKNCVVIVDEFQSFDIKELMAIVTRFGNIKCKMIFIGDINQSDIDKKYLAVNVFKEILDGIKDIAFFQFDRNDIVRDPILIEITDKYEKMKEEGKLSINRKNT